MELYIYDRDGSILQTTPLKEENTTISISNLSDGIYLLSLSIDNVTYDVKRLIIKK